MIIMENRIPDISDWLQFLEAKEALWTNILLGIAAIFISAIIGIPVLYQNGDFYVILGGLIGLFIFWIFTFIIIQKIGKEVRKSQKLLNKIMKNNFTDVYEIRNEWFGKEEIKEPKKLSNGKNKKK